MKILQLYRRFEDSGPGTQPLELAKYFRKQGHDVLFASSGGILSDEMKKLGFIHLDIPTLAINRRDPISVLRTVFTLRRIINKYDIDIIHGHNAASTCCAYVASFMTRKKPKRFQSVRGLDNTQKWRNLIYHLNFAKLFAVCQFTREWLMELGVPQDRIIVTYNGVDANRFDPQRYTGARIRQEFDIPHDAILLGHVGAFSGGKGQHHIVQGVAKLREEFPNVYAIMVGDGRSYGNAYFERTRDLARSLSVEDRCKFAGFRRDIPEFQAAFDIHVQPSTRPKGEMFPNAILEAMSMGNPWIGSDVSGLPEMTDDDKHGLLFPRGDYDSFVDRLRTLVGNEALRKEMGARCRDRVLQKYTMERVGARILKRYTGEV